MIDRPVLEPLELVWIAFEGTVLFGAGTTALHKDGVAEIIGCGGHKHGLWVEQAEGVVSAWARSCGASKLTMRGRFGWARYFRELGWDVLGKEEDGRTVFEKRL
jgi:hypothetical protein